MISWPVIINYKDDDELTFISNEADWTLNSNHYFHYYSEHDELIDSTGKIFILTYNEKSNIMETDNSVTLKKF